MKTWSQMLQSAPTLAPGKHVGERPDAGTWADIAAFADPLWMYVHAQR